MARFLHIAVRVASRQYAGGSGLWLAINPNESQATVCSSEDEANSVASTLEGGHVSPVGRAGVVEYFDNDIIGEPVDFLPTSPEQISDMAKGVGETVWYDTQDAKPGDVISACCTTAD